MVLNPVLLHPVVYLFYYRVKTLTEVHKKTLNVDFKVFLFLWYLAESNRGHKDFQSFALPTELRYLTELGVQKYSFFLNRQNYFSLFCFIIELYFTSW